MEDDDSSVDLAAFGIGRLFKLVHDGVVVADAAEEKIVLWNDCAGAIFGYTEEEARALPLHALVPEVLRDAHRSGIAKYQASGEGNLIGSGHPVELVGLRKDGSEVPIELTLTKIPETSDDGHRFALAIIRDLTDRKEAEEARSRRREEDFQRRQALQLNDTIVQGLAVAKLSLERGDVELGLRAVVETLRTAQATVGRILEQLEERHGPMKAGDLVIHDLEDGTDT